MRNARITLWDLTPPPSSRECAWYTSGARWQTSRGSSSRRSSACGARARLPVAGSGGCDLCKERKQAAALEVHGVGGWHGLSCRSNSDREDQQDQGTFPRRLHHVPTGVQSAAPHRTRLVAQSSQRGRQERNAHSQQPNGCLLKTQHRITSGNNNPPYIVSERYRPSHSEWTTVASVRVRAVAGGIYPRRHSPKRVWPKKCPTFTIICPQRPLLQTQRSLPPLQPPPSLPPLQPPRRSFLLRLSRAPMRAHMQRALRQSRL